ncbi:MAG: threonylcarbamoyl-AMP synthase [Flavobacteriales bacterium]|nr:threonylcarbamoyl-AMP synthase [Flavobacteriales bacterium]
MIEETVRTLKTGGTILYPTDTIWGLGCDATNEDAVRKIYALKNREDSKSLIILIDHVQRLSQYLTHIPPGALELIEAANKPLTLIYPDASGLAANVLAEDGSVAIRIARHAFCEQLIASFGKPIVSTSANISGQPYPVTFDEVSPDILNGVDYVVNLPTEISNPKPSTIIKLDRQGNQTLIRP